MSDVVPSRIKLSFEEAPMQVLMHLYVDGAPVMDENGFMQFKKMLGGIPQEKRIYHLQDGKPIDSFRKISAGYFVPVDICSVNNAMVGQRYAVFMHGSQVFIERKDYKILYYVVQGDDKVFYDASFFPFQSHQLSGNPAFECQLRMRMARYSALAQKDHFEILPLSELEAKVKEVWLPRVVDSLVQDLEDIKGLQSLKDGQMYPHECEKYQRKIDDIKWRIDEKIEWVSRHYDKNDLQRIALLKLIGMYLHEAKLEKDAELVRIDL